MTTSSASRVAALVLASAALVTASCSTVKVNTDWDPEASFAGLRSYAWLPGKQAETGDVRIDNPLLVKRVRAAIDAQLQAQGYQRVNAAEADFLVGYHLALDSKLDVSTINNYYGYGYGRYGYWGAAPMGSTTTTVREYEVGTLIVDIVNRLDDQLMWRGEGQSRVTAESNPEESEKKVAEVVAAILKRFPPKLDS